MRKGKVCKVDKRTILVSAVFCFVAVFLILAAQNINHANAVMRGEIPPAVLFITFHIDQAAFLIYSTLLALLVGMVYISEDE